MNYRRAVPADFRAIAALDRVAWTSNRDADYIPDGEHVWRLWVEHALTFCAENDGHIVGAIVAFPSLSGALCVHKLFVQQDLRGRGIGSGLFTLLLEAIDRQGAAAFLTVDPENQVAVRMYERLGFAEREFVPGYYRQTEDRFVLTRAGRARSGGTL